MKTLSTNDIRRMTRDLIKEVGGQKTLSILSGVPEYELDHFLGGHNLTATRLTNFLGYSFDKNSGSYVRTPGVSMSTPIVALNTALAAENIRLSTENKGLRVKLAYLQRQPARAAA